MKNLDSLYLIRKWFFFFSVFFLFSLFYFILFFLFRPLIASTSYFFSKASDHQGSVQRPPFFVSFHPWFTKSGMVCFSLTLHITLKRTKTFSWGCSHMSTFYLLFQFWGQQRLCHVHVKISYSTTKAKVKSSKLGVEKPKSWFRLTTNLAHS